MVQKMLKGNKKVSKVLIFKYSDPELWYSDLIGYEFYGWEDRENNPGVFFIYVDYNTWEVMGILLRDVIILE